MQTEGRWPIVRSCYCHAKGDAVGLYVHMLNVCCHASSVSHAPRRDCRLPPGTSYSKTSFPVGSRWGVLFMDCRRRESS